MARASVLAARGAVVVGSVAGPVVIVVRGVEKVHLASVAVTEQGVAQGRTAAERHGDGIARGVAAAHRLAPVAISHDNSFRSRAESVKPPRSGASVDAS